MPKNATKEDGSPFVVLVAVSGGKDSAVLLSMINEIIGRRRDVELVAGCVTRTRPAGSDNRTVLVLAARRKCLFMQVSL